MKTIVKVISFALIGAYLFLNVQFVLVERPIFAYNQNEEYLKINEMYSLERNSIDVLFLGTSQINFSVSPMEIYEKQGITSFNLGTAAQSYMLTYYLLSEFYKNQCPKVVFVDANSLFRKDIDHYSILPVTNNTYLSKEKIKLCRDYYEFLSELDDMSYIDAGVKASAILFPFLTYKERWDQLTQNDIRAFVPNNYYLYGYTPASHIVSSYTYPAMIDADEDALIELGFLDEENNNYSVDEKSASWLKRIIELCKIKDSKVVLLKAPSFKSPVDYISEEFDRSWTIYKHDAVEAWLSSEFPEISFIDLNYINDFLLDPFLDTYDGGMHLNYHGALMVSEYIADFLVETYGEGLRQTNKAFEEDIVQYDRLKNIMLQEMNLSFDELLNIYMSEGNFDLLITYNSTDNYISNQIKTIMQQEGITLFLQDDINDKYWGTYVCILSGNGNIVEQIDRTESITTLKNNGNEFLISSTSRDCSIKDGYGTEYCLNWPGFNFAVYDELSGCIVDIFNIQGKEEDSYGIYRYAPTISQLLKDYEKVTLKSAYGE